MFSQIKKITKMAKKEVINKVITSLFIQGLALVIPVFWSKTITEVTDANYKVGYYLIIITLLLSLFYYLWSYLNQKTWYTLYNKIYIEYTNATISETKNINKINLGEYTNILNNDIDIICNFLCNLVTRILQIIEFFIIYAYFISFNFPIFISTVIVSILMLIIYIKAGSLVQKLNIKRKSTLDNKTIMLHKLYSSLANKKNNINKLKEILTNNNLVMNEEVKEKFIENNLDVPKKNMKFIELLKRPEISIDFLANFIDISRFTNEEKEEVTIEVKYEGYIKKEYEQKEKLLKMESKQIPKDIDYNKIKNIASEARQKLSLVRPETIAQASRISGVNPVDISLLLIYLKKEYNKND